MGLLQIQQQKQVLSMAMQQSLHFLQLPICSLQEYLSELATENPLMDVEDGVNDFVSVSGNMLVSDAIFESD